MEKSKNLNAEISPDGTYIRRNNLPAKKVMHPNNRIEKAINTVDDVSNDSNNVVMDTTTLESKTSLISSLVDKAPDIPINTVNKPSEVMIGDDNPIINDNKITEISLNEFYLNGKHIKFNKWKVKTRSELHNCHSYIERRRVLVYNQLEKFVPLDMEEFNYVLYRIRDFSFSRPIKYNFTCNECGKDYEVAYNLKDLYRPKNGYKEDTEFNHLINGKNTKIIFSSIKPDVFDAYENIITNENDAFKILLLDFIFHIKSIDNKEISNYDSFIKDIETWDVDIFELFFNDYNNIKFYVDTTNITKCPHCLHEMVLNFDEFPNFYPDSWVVEG